MTISIQDCLMTNHQWPKHGSKQEPVGTDRIAWVECKLCGKPKPIITKRTRQPRSEAERQHTARLKSSRAALATRLWATENKKRRENAERFIEENVGGLRHE